MTKRTLATVTVAAIFALTIVASNASAATLSDLEALGYTVTIDWTVPGPDGGTCTVYTVAGYGISTMLNSCDPDFQGQVDSIANPAAHCDRRWQYLHPDQQEAWATIARAGWTVTADKCADRFTVTNPNDQSILYTGAGAGLVGVAATIGPPPVPPPPPTPAPAPTPAPPAPAPVPDTPPAATPPAAKPVPSSPTVTLTLEQLQQIVARAVAKAVKAERARAARAARAHRRARPSSHPKSPGRRR